MKYKVGDKVRIKSGLNNMHTSCVFVTSRMINKEGAIATIERVDSEDNTYKIEGLSEWWEAEMFEPVEQFSVPGIVPVNDPRLSDIEVRYPGFINTAEDERYIIRADKVPGGAIRVVFQDTLESLRAFGTKKSTGIESRKDIRKRLLKL